MSPARTCTVLALLAAVAFAQTEPDAAVTHAAAGAPLASAATQPSEPTAVAAATAAAPLAAAPTAAAPTAAGPTPAAPVAAAPTGAATLAPPAGATQAPGATAPDGAATSPPPSDKPDAAGVATSPATAAPSLTTRSPIATGAASSPADPSSAATAPSTSPSLPPTTGAATITAGAAATATDSSPAPNATTSPTDSWSSTGAASDTATPLATGAGTQEVTEATAATAATEAPWPVLVTQEPRSARVREGANASLACAARGPRAALRGARVSWHRHSPYGERVEHRAGHSELSQDEADRNGDDADEEVELRAHLLMLQVLESRDEGAFYCVVTSSSGDGKSYGVGSTLLISARHSGWRGLGDGVLGALGAACAGLGVLLGLLVALVPGVRDKLSCGKSASVDI